jgi:hypothetical protein
VLGAAGFTGGLVADELARRGLPHRLGARDAGRLARREGTPNCEIAGVDISIPASIAAFLEGVDVVINTVGPFFPSGLGVIEAASRSGVHYVDCSGELAFLRAVFKRYAGADTGVVVACGFQAVPGDCGASVALEELGADGAHVHVHYSAKMLPSRGTARTLVKELAEPGLRSELHRITAGRRTRRGLAMPLAEQVTVPHAHPHAPLITTVGIPGVALLNPLIPRLMPRARRVLTHAADRLPAGPPAQLRRRDRARVLVIASRGGRTAGVQVKLRDTYGLTARFLVEAALRVEGSGVMSPAGAFGAIQFLDAVSGDGPPGSFAWSRVGGDAR